MFRPRTVSSVRVAAHHLSQSEMETDLPGEEARQINLEVLYVWP
jgi:hypothetical protein